MSIENFQPDWFSRPGDTLAALMSARGLTSNELAIRLGCDRQTIYSLMTGAGPIDESLAESLADVLGGTSKFWRKRQSVYEQALEKAASSLPTEAAKSWLSQIPVSGMASAGWIERPLGRDEALKACLAYFGVTRPEEWRNRYANISTDISFRTSATFSSSVGSISAWLRQAEIETALMYCKQWDKSKFSSNIDSIRKLTVLRRPSAFLPKLRSICAESGVALVVLRAPQGCRASGAARFFSRDRAMIIVSFRHLSEDHFWFTFFHEAGHLLLHDKSETFIDAEDTVSDVKEREANLFAATTLIPDKHRVEMQKLTNQRQMIMRFAASIGISSGVVVGQMQHQGLISQASMNFLKRRYTWTDIEAGLD